MAFRFKLNQPIGKEVRRLGLEQIERTLQLLDSADRAVGVHEARKGMKRIRTLLRLVRPGLSDRAYQAENARFRDIGRLLAPSRDRHVNLQTLTLLEAQPDRVAHTGLAALRKVLVDEVSDPPTGAGAEALEAARVALAEARKRFTRLAVSPSDFSVIEAGIARSLRAGRKALAAAYSTPSDEAIHEWRKTVQHHWRHMALLSRAWPEYFDARVSTAKMLSQSLGEDHDLSMLRARVAACDPARLSSQQAAQIVALIEVRQTALRRAAELRGRQLFAERPRRLASRVADLWKLAEQHRAEAAASDEPRRAERIARDTG